MVGAQGGSSSPGIGGNGANMTGTFFLTSGLKIYLFFIVQLVYFLSFIRNSFCLLGTTLSILVGCVGNVISAYASKLFCSICCFAQLLTLCLACEQRWWWRFLRGEWIYPSYRWLLFLLSASLSSFVAGGGGGGSSGVTGFPGQTSLQAYLGTGAVGYGYFFHRHLFYLVCYFVDIAFNAFDFF